MALASFVFHCDCFALPTLAFTASYRLASNLVTSLIAVSIYLVWLMLGELSLPHVFETLTRRIRGASSTSKDSCVKRC
jgi:formate-dependent nitrite reductase membrane component NrfD